MPDESARTQQELDLTAKKKGMLAYVYFDTVAGRVRLRLQGGVEVPFDAGTRAKPEPYENADITHAQIAEARTAGIIVEAAGEVAALNSLLLFIAEKWNTQQAMLNALDTQFKDAIEVLRALAAGETPKEFGAFQQKYGVRGVVL